MAHAACSVARASSTAKSCTRGKIVAFSAIVHLMAASSDRAQNAPATSALTRVLLLSLMRPARYEMPPKSTTKRWFSRLFRVISMMAHAAHQRTSAASSPASSSRQSGVRPSMRAIESWFSLLLRASCARHAMPRDCAAATRDPSIASSGPIPPDLAMADWVSGLSRAISASAAAASTCDSTSIPLRSARSGATPPRPATMSWISRLFAARLPSATAAGFCALPLPSSVSNSGMAPAFAISR